MDLIAAFELYYIVLEPVAGLLYLPVAVLMYLTAVYLTNFPPHWIPLQSLGYGSAPAALALFIISWIAQFISHGVFEKRKPALFNHFIDALVVAPYFVHFEFLFSVLNYRPKLHQRIQKAAMAKLAMLKAGKSI